MPCGWVVFCGAFLFCIVVVFVSVQVFLSQDLVNSLGLIARYRLVAKVPLIDLLIFQADFCCGGPVDVVNLSSTSLSIGPQYGINKSGRVDLRL